MHALLLALALLGSQDARIFPLDPVQLCAGVEARGRGDLAFTYGRFTYRFAEPESLAAFRAEPERFGIQLGGGCARMGALSGVGNVDLWTVHEERLYLFASEECRAGFLEDPSSLLFQPAPMPRVSAQQKEAGDALMVKLVEGLGGAAALHGVTSVSLRRDERQEHEDRHYATGEALWFDFDGDLTHSSWWGNFHRESHLRKKRRIVRVVDGEVSDERFTPDPAQERELRDAALRHPLHLARAHAAGEVIAWDAGVEDVGGTPVHWIALHGPAGLTRLGLDEQGILAASRHVGRAQDRRFRELTHRFTAFEEHQGLRIPTTWVTRAEGQDPQTQRWTSVRLNAPEPAVPPLSTLGR